MFKHAASLSILAVAMIVNSSSDDRPFQFTMSWEVMSQSTASWESGVCTSESNGLV